jgi:lipopolysaccharide export system protein LptA
VVTCNDFLVELKREFIKAENEVKIVYDENTSLTGDALEWDRQNDLVKVTGTPQIDFKDWRINGERIEGQINKGIFIIFGPVKGIGNDESFQAGQVVFDHIRDKIFLKNNPVVIQGKNQFTAPEIVYDLNTRKISTKSDLRMN